MSKISINKINKSNGETFAIGIRIEGHEHEYFVDINQSRLSGLRVGYPTPDPFDKTNGWDSFHEEVIYSVEAVN